MKIRFAVVTILGLTGILLPCVRGALPPAVEPLADYDKRTASTQASAVKPSLVTPAQQQGASTLRAQAPGVRINRDGLLGAPKWISPMHGFLTGPNGRGNAVSAANPALFAANDPHRSIKAFLNEHSALMGYDAQALASARIKRDYITPHSGLRTVIWEQTVDGIPVFEATLAGNITRDEELVNLASRFLPDAPVAASVGTPNRAALVSNPAIPASRALANAAANLGVALPEGSITFAQGPQGAERGQTARAANLFGPAWSRLVWLPMDQSSMRLCWRLTVTVRRPQPERYLVLVDAETGEVLLRRARVFHISPATYNVYTSDSPSPFSPGSPTPNGFQPPILTNRTLVTISALDTIASPNGWINDGDNQTSGNNAIAFLDRNFDDVPDVPLPQGVGPARVFNFPLNLGQAPLNYASASTVQLFYQANLYHDRLYQLGFTESAGNFQGTNFGRGGFGQDALRCLVQAGADIGIANNAAFLPGFDGETSYVFMFIFDGTTPDRDGSLDAEVVIHEFTHGLSDRLVGGGVGISALQTGGMGEGWSDFYALCLLSEPSDNVNGVYAAGGYLTYQVFGITDFTDNYYYGIRRYPYSTDMTKNPLTFKDIDPIRADPHAGVPISPLFGGGDPSEVHNQGEVWCMTLREVWANMVSKHGWVIGNDLTLRLVTDGMKLGPANPSFLEARDAILLADQVNNGGENFFEIWQGFAKRGMGYNAQGPDSDTTIGVLESFDLPPGEDGILEVQVTPPHQEALFAGETNVIFVRVTDGIGLTNASVTATIVGSTNLPFRNDGVLPDLTANNPVHSATLRVPVGPSTISLNLIVSAPGKENLTNLVTYFIVAPPPNDLFTNAIKLPVTGTNYLTSNRRATTEPTEPAHAGVFSQSGSLWWSFTSPVNTNVLVDTAGSGVRTVIGVYTNQTLPTLQSVASAFGTLDRSTAFVKFNALAGVTYRIAVAGFDLNNRGTLSLNFEPGGQPDTNAPTVTIDSPPNGLLVTTNRLLVMGSAVDPSPNPSGIRDILISVSTSPTISPFGITGPPSTNWLNFVGLLPGMNRIRVTAMDFAGNRSSPATVHVTYRFLDPINDFFANASSLNSTSGVTSINTLNATKEVGEPNHVGTAGGRSAWWNFTAPQDGILTLTTSNSTFDTVMALYSGSSVGSLTLITDNDDANGSVRFSRIVKAMKGGQTVRIAVDGFEGAGGVVFLSHSFAPGPVYHVGIGSTVGGTTTPLSADVASNGTLVVSAQPNPNYRFDIWDGAVVSLNNPLTLTVNSDMNLTAHFLPVPFTDDFESGNLRHIAWTTNGPGTGNKPWFVQGSVVAGGVFAARSGTIANGQQSTLILTANFRAGNGSFDYRVSSEPSFDQLKFLVDASQLQQWSGDTGWGTFAFPLTAGTHTLEWRYTKDPNTTSGLDAAFIDNVSLPIVVGIDGSTPANLQLQRQSDGAFFINLTGQANQQYILQTSTNLVNWQNLSTSIAVGGFIRIPVPASSSGTQYYRALASP